MNSETTASDKAGTQEEIETADAGVTGLESLVSDESRSELLLEVFSKYLDPKISGRTYEDLTLAVSSILPSESLAIITWICQPGGEPIDDLINRLKVNPQTDTFLRRIAALFGPRLSKAYFSSDRQAPQRDDWLSFSRRVLQDVESGDYSIAMRIQKLNGESISIEGDGDSMARFARQSLRTLVRIGDRAAFSSRDLERLTEEWNAFRKIVEGVEKSELEDGQTES